MICGMGWCSVVRVRSGVGSGGGVAERRIGCRYQLFILALIWLCWVCDGEKRHRVMYAVTNVICSSGLGLVV